MDTGDDKKEEEIAPNHPATHEDEVQKLKGKIPELNQRHNTLLNAAKYNSEVAQCFHDTRSSPQLWLALQASRDRVTLVHLDGNRI
ncbi:unnamed protein product [Fusarium graminearum]|nr:unnamed protein product [Fusarium graminearum]